MTKILQAFGLLVVAAFLASCGGGGGCAGTSLAGADQCNGGGTPTAADLTLVLDKSSLTNTGSTTVAATATAVDANRNVLAGIPVVLSVDSNATVAASGTVTDAQGVVIGAVGIGADRANRIVTVTARSGSLERTASFNVVGATLSSTAVPAELAPSSSGAIQYRVLDSNAAPMQGIRVVVSSPGGVQTEGVTDFNGRYDFVYTAPASLGPFQITADAAGVNLATTVVVNSGSTITPPAVGTVASASVSSVPDVVTVNTSTSTNQTEIRALFIGEGNAPIKNMRVRFDLNGDPFSIGGTLASGSNRVFSDANGLARTSYIAGSRSSGANALTIRACWDYNDFAVGTCPHAATTQVVVVNEPLSVTIGTDALIEIDVPELLYIKRFVVQVVDSSGQVKADSPVTAKLELLQYLKGSWSIQTLAGKTAWGQGVTAVCDSEDINRNGINEIYSNGGVEDANANKKLDPSTADIGFFFENGNITNSSGIVVIRMQYPQSLASWVQYQISVTAGVLGTEGNKSLAGYLPVPAEVVNNVVEVPPFLTSPYGIETSPSVLVTTPEGKSAFLCTNPN